MWLKEKHKTTNIVGINTHYNDKTSAYELWATKNDGKTFLVISSEKEGEVLELKEAMDFAIETNQSVFELGE